MIDLGRISAVQQRITEIQEQIGFPARIPVPGTDFSQALQREMEKGAEVKPTAPAESASTPQKPEPVTRGTESGGNYRGATAETGSMAELMDAAAKKYNVDARLVSAVAEVESDKDQSVISSAGAIGVMQLMPETAAALGVDPYDTAQNIEGGTKYLRQMLDSFGGDVKKALAAYNAGPQAVRDYNGVPPYRETQNYVNKVLDIYQ